MESARRLLAVPALSALAVLCLILVPARVGAATDVYPAGAGTFSGGAQGWQVTEANCSVPLLCTASGGYDGGAGDPPGSIAANTSITLNLLTLFKSTVTLQSPDFTVTRAGAATLHLDRQFTSGSLVDLAPQLDYTVALIDRTTGSRAEPLGETLATVPGFVGKDSSATVRPGHTYAISIKAETSSSVVGTGLLAGATSARFDNVSLTVESSGGAGGDGKGGGRGGSGGGDLTRSRLASLIQSGSLVGPAVLQGGRLTVRVRCPRQVGRTCSIALRGQLKKRRPVTNTRRTGIRQARVKRVAFRVKPGARAAVATRSRLLFKENVRAGKVKVTVYKRLKLIRR